MLKQFISKSSSINFAKDFIFSFCCNSLNEEKNFLMNLTVGKNYLKLCDASNDGYKISENNEFTLKEITLEDDESNLSSVSFLNDELYLRENTIFQKYNNEKVDNIKGYIYIDGQLYIVSDKYSLEIIDSKTYIKCYNNKDKNGNFLIPHGINGNFNEKELYFIDENNPLDIKEKKTYQIIVSNKTKTISLWYKTDKNFKKIKSFSYSSETEKGNIKLELNNIELSDLHFSFFDSDIK